jgi:hypothetical protein
VEGRQRRSARFRSDWELTGDRLLGWDAGREGQALGTPTRKGGDSLLGLAERGPVGSLSLDLIRPRVLSQGLSPIPPAKGGTGSWTELTRRTRRTLGGGEAAKVRSV